MRRRVSICVGALLIILLLSAGCQHTRQRTAGNQAGDIWNAPIRLDRGPSSYYYYLESRIHIKNKAYQKAKATLQKALAKDPDSYTLTRDMIGLLMREKKETQAVQLIENFTRRNPNSVDGLVLLVQLKKKTFEEKKLVEILNRILSIDASNKESYLRLGKIYINNKDHAAALALFRQMAARFPDYYVAQFYLGDVHMSLKQYAKAEELFLKTIELEPDLVAPRMQLIDIYRLEKKKGYHQKIIDTYEQILTIEPDNHTALFGQALAYFKDGQKDRAKEIFMELGRGADSNSRLIMAAADEFISGKRYDDAIIVFSQMRDTNPDNSTLNFFLGMAFQAADKFEAAIKAYLNVKPDHAQYKKTILSIAYLYKQMEQEETAINYLEQQYALFPRDIDMISYLSSFYEGREQYQEAIKLLNTALADSPDNTTLLFRLGTIQDKTGQKNECIETMKKIIRIDPKDASALNYLGYTYADRGIKLDQALDLITRAHRLKPEDGYITDSLGWVYFQMGNYENAVKYLEKAASLTAFETIISDHLGDAYLKLNRYNDALATFKKALANAQEQDKDLAEKIKKKIKTLKKKLND